MTARERAAALAALVWRFRRPVIVVGALIAAGAASISRNVLPDPRRATLEDVARIASLVRAGVHRAILPAGLAAPHAADPATADCTACHELSALVPDRKCLACHEGIVTNAAPAPNGDGALAANARTTSTVHATFRGHCRDCHADHREHLVDLDREGFNHARARFPLEGEHLRIRCEACHEQPSRVAPGAVRMQFQGLAHGRCTDCHADPHRGTLEPTACDACHRATGFVGDELRFDHARDSTFALRGAHAALACGACHAKDHDGAPADRLGRAVLRGLEAADCDACHTDPHTGSLSPKRCDGCHDPGAAAWRGEALRFDHARDASFGLDAAHAALACDACHLGAAYRPLEASCAGCHAAEARALEGHLPGVAPAGPPDPHADLVDCRRCHLPDDGPDPPAASFAERCAGCHTPRHGELFLDRERRLGELLARARAAHPAARAELEAIARQGHHAFVAVSRALKERAR